MRRNDGSAKKSTTASPNPIEIYCGILCLVLFIGFAIGEFLREANCQSLSKSITDDDCSFDPNICDIKGLECETHLPSKNLKTEIEDGIKQGNYYLLYGVLGGIGLDALILLLTCIKLCYLFRKRGADEAKITLLEEGLFNNTETENLENASEENSSNEIQEKTP